MYKTILCALLTTTLLSGCGSASSSLSSRLNTAIKIADSGQLQKEIIPAGIFNLTTWGRVNDPAAPINIYIEGDGLAWLNKYTKSRNPTPPDPLTLRLAAKDGADNVIYIARPCQYSSWNKERACPDFYWTTGRTAPEVMEAYKEALDHIKLSKSTGGFHLTGYSGGAAVALLLAENRNDILSIRTVAGNLDYATFTKIHSISPMSGSLDPITTAVKISHIPQQHFIGERDKVIPKDIFNSWKYHSNETSCIHSSVVAKASHDKGWVEHWEELLEIKPVCQ